MKKDYLSGLGYWFAHFSVEILCFFILYNVFDISENAWFFFCMFDIFAFASQPFLGYFCEKHIHFMPGPTGGFLLMAGALVIFFTRDVFFLQFIGLIILTAGNALVHLSGALETLKVSEGGLSESAIFVGGGSFGLIAGRLIGAYDRLFFIPLICEAVAIVIMIILDKRVKERFGADAYDFDRHPVKHELSTGRAIGITVFILAAVITVRSYIGYGLPTAWNYTTVRMILLYIFMGSGKMLGGILSDRFGARNIGMVSCLLALPALLFGDHIMWLSLIGVLMFSMTMAVTLGGLVSVLPSNPGVAFGITTLALLLGVVPTFFTKMPSRFICNIMIVILSVLAAAGLWYTVNNRKRKNI